MFSVVHDVFLEKSQMMTRKKLTIEPSKDPTKLAEEVAQTFSLKDLGVKISN